MKSIFYGTGAAEGIPDPFCECYLCSYAREHKGKDVRTRSMFRLDAATAIDMGADSYMQANLYGDLLDLEQVLITHTHEDHFCYMMMNVWDMGTHRRHKTLHYYFVDKGYDIIEQIRSNAAFMKNKLPIMEEKGVIACHRLEFYRSYTIGDNIVTPLRGHHFGNMKDQSANFLVETANGKQLYYGCDTGKYEPETLEYLKGRKLDVLISECTNGDGEDAMPDPTHLSFTTCLDTFRTLRKLDAITDDTVIYLTHINHLHTAHHEKLQQMWNAAGLPNRCIVAWDGMEIEV